MHLVVLNSIDDLKIYANDPDNSPTLHSLHGSIDNRVHEQDEYSGYFSDETGLQFGYHIPTKPEQAGGQYYQLVVDSSGQLQLSDARGHSSDYENSSNYSLDENGTTPSSTGKYFARPESQSK